MRSRPIQRAQSWFPGTTTSLTARSPRKTSCSRLNSSRSLPRPSRCMTFPRQNFLKSQNLPLTHLFIAQRPNLLLLPPRRDTSIQGKGPRASSLPHHCNSQHHTLRGPPRRQAGEPPDLHGAPPHHGLHGHSPHRDPRWRGCIRGPSQKQRPQRHPRRLLDPGPVPADGDVDV